MDLLSLLRTLGALGLVLGMLAGALWAVRRYDLKLPGRVSATRRKRVELVERLSVDAKRSVALIRRDGCEHLILFGPDGNAVIETGIAAPAPVETPEPAPIQADLALLRTAFGRLVDRSTEATSPPPPPPAAPAAPVAPPAAPRTPRRRQRREHGHSARWNRAAVREALRG